MKVNMLQATLCCMLITTVAVAGTNKPERDALKLKGKVKSVLQVEFSVKGDDRGDTVGKSYATFSEGGFKTYGATYVAGGEIFSQNMYTYGANDVPLKNTNYQYTGGKKSYQCQVMLHDAKGFLKSTIYLNPPGNKFDRKLIFLNDNQGNPVEEFDSVKEDGKFLAKGFKYNNRDSNTEMDTYASEDPNKYTNILLIRYNDKGCRVHMIDYSLPDSAGVRNEYKCDDKNNRIEDIQYANTLDDKTGAKVTALQQRTTYAYDANNNMIEKDDYGVDGKLQAKETMQYDDHNNMISDATHSSDGSDEKHEYKYEYDANGNWTKKTVTTDGKLQHIFEQHIDYFQ